MLGRIGAPACLARASACMTRARAFSKSRLLPAACSISAFNSGLPNPSYQSLFGQDDAGLIGGVANAAGTVGGTCSTSCNTQPAAKKLMMPPKQTRTCLILEALQRGEEDAARNQDRA